MTRPKYMQIITQFLSMTAKEGMLLPIGIVMDLLDMEKERRGIDRGDD